MNRYGPLALKSVPDAESIATLLTLTSHGTTGAVTNQGAARLDLSALTGYHEGTLRIELKSTGGIGATPTSVGASKTFTLKYAFANEKIDLADVPTVLATAVDSLVCALPDAVSAQATGVLTIAGVPALDAKVIINDPLTATRSLYNWINSGLLDLNASPFNVATGVTAAAAALDLIDAINLTAYPSPAYSTGMLASTLITAATGGAGVVNVKAIEYGAVGNSYTTLETGANTSFGAGTLTGGSSAGTAFYGTAPFTHRGKYLYVWYDRTAFSNANSLINVTAKLIRL